MEGGRGVARFYAESFYVEIHESLRLGSGVSSASKLRGGPACELKALDEQLRLRRDLESFRLLLCLESKVP